MIEFNDVKLNIKNTGILSDINFKIEDNSVVAFVGNKNAGKSSILKLLAGIYTNYSGEIKLNGVNIEDVKNKKIAMVHEKKEFVTDLNVTEYLKFYALFSSEKYNDIENIIDRQLKSFSLLPYKYTDISQIDNESYKLLQIIRVLLMNPDIILFDNLFSIDDNEFNERIIKFLKTLIGKKTLIFANRDLKYVEKICKYVGVLDAGNLLAFDDIQALYEKIELNNKVKVKVLGNEKDAIKILNENEYVSNILYEDNTIIFSIKGDKVKESEILRLLIKDDIKVYSYVKESVTFEQLYSRLKD